MEELSLNDLQCTHCEAVIADGNKFCVSCGYPQRGTAGEKSKFHAERIMNNSKAKEAPRLIKKARNALYIIGAINFLYGLLLFFTQDDSATLIAGSILAIIYFILGYWTEKKALIALVLALLLYLTTIVLSGILEPSSVFRGLILKGVIIYFLAKGINSALHLRKMNAA